MTNREPLTTIWSVFSDIESVVIVGLCSGTVLFFLDAVGVDVIANLQELDPASFEGVSSMVVFALVSKVVERFRAAVGSDRDAPTAG